MTGWDCSTSSGASPLCWVHPRSRVSSSHMPEVTAPAFSLSSQQEALSPPAHPRAPTQRAQRHAGSPGATLPHLQRIAPLTPPLPAQGFSVRHPVHCPDRPTSPPRCSWPGGLPCSPKHTLSRRRSWFHLSPTPPVLLQRAPRTQRQVALAYRPLLLTQA